MSVSSLMEYELTKQKLAGILRTLEAIDGRPITSPQARAASRRSLRALANQLFEEVARYEIAQGMEPRTTAHLGWSAGSTSRQDAN